MWPRTCAGRFAEDLSALFDVGFMLGQALMERVLPLLDGPAVSYGKGAIVGVDGDLGHGHALLHPKLGKAMRDPIGGGQALIPSAAKVGAAAARRWTSRSDTRATRGRSITSTR